MRGRSSPTRPCWTSSPPTKPAQGRLIGRLELSQSILEAQRYGRTWKKGRPGRRRGAPVRAARLASPSAFAGRRPDAELAELTELPPAETLIERASQKRSDVVLAKSALESARSKLD
jgi:hypothetical protein